MRRNLYILFLCTLSVLPTFAQRNFAQELIDLMQQGKCFEARELRRQYSEYLPLNDKTYDLVYKSHMAMFFNKPDSISFYLENLTTHHELAMGPVIAAYYGKLLQVYDDTQQFEKGIHIRFEAAYNGVPMQTWFDTGVSAYLLMTKAIAEEIGVRIVDKDTPKFMNGVQTDAWAGIVDCIDLKNIKIYNIPVFINDGYSPNEGDTLTSEAKSKLESIRRDKQIIMGLPLMKMIGKFEFDWEKQTVCFPEITGEPTTNSSSNIYIENNNLYQELNINGSSYVGHVDTGDDDFVNMSFSFYEKNKGHIDIDSLAEKKPINHIRATGIFFNVPYEIVKAPKVYSNGEIVNADTCRVLITDGTLSHLNSFDGTIGAGLSKHLGPKVIFDFVNMEIKRKEE